MQAVQPSVDADLLFANRKYPLFVIKEIADLFVDACVQDSEGSLVFLSVYGRDTSLNQFYAAMQLGSYAGGIRSFSLAVGAGGAMGDSQRARQVAVGDVDDLAKLNGRLPMTMFGNLSQAFVYQKRVIDADKSNGRAVLLYPCSEKRLSAADRCAIDRQLWSLVQQLSPVALLDHWRAVLFAECPSLWQSFSDTSYPPLGEVSAWRVQLPSSFTETITALIRSNRLTLVQ